MSGPSLTTMQLPSLSAKHLTKTFHLIQNAKNGEVLDVWIELTNVLEMGRLEWEVLSFYETLQAHQ